MSTFQDWMTYPCTPGMTQQYHESDLARRQREHLERVSRHNASPHRACMHDSCSQCVGTGIKRDGTACVHMISCPCPKCSPYSL